LTWRKYVLGRTNHVINASETIWNFFKQYDINGLLKLDEINPKSNFKISPNPMSRSTKVNSTFSIIKYVIYDIQGKVVRDEEVGDSEFMIEKTVLQLGIYILEVLGETQILRQKLVVQ